MAMNKKWLAGAGVPAVIATLLLLVGDKGSVVDNRPLSEYKVGEEITHVVKLKKGEKRDNIKIFKGKDNKRQAHVYSNPVNYFDSDDFTYKPIDLTEKEISALAKLNPLRKHDKYVDAGNYKATWMNGKQHDYTYFDKSGDYSIKYEFLSDTESITIETIPTNTGVKQNYILEDDNATFTLKWAMETNAVMDGADSNSELIFRDDAGEFKFRVTKPTAWDANKDNVIVSSSVVGDTLVYEVNLTGEEVFPITVDPNTTVDPIYAEDGYLAMGHELTYSDARDPETAETRGTYFLIGQLTGFSVMRADASFIIPELAAVSACSLFVDGSSNGSTDDFDVYILSSTYGPTLTTADYNEFDGWVSGGAHTGTVLNDTWNTASYSADWNTIIFNSAGRDSVVAAANDTLWIVLISKEDYDNSEPTDSESVSFTAGGLGATGAYLSFTYASVPTAPSSFAIVDSSTVGFDVTWSDDSDDEVGFFVKNAADTTTVAVVGADVEAATVEGLNPWQTYELYVVAYNSIGYSNNSNTDTDVTKFAFNHTYYLSIPVSDAKTAKFEPDSTRTSYTNVRQAVDLAFLSTVDADTIGQYKNANNDFNVYRLGMAFNVTTLPYVSTSNFSILGDTLSIDIDADGSTADFFIDIYNTKQTFGATGALYKNFVGYNQSTAFDASIGTGLGTSGISPGIFNIIFNQAGEDTLEATIARGGEASFLLVSNQDSVQSEPAGAEYVVLDTTATVLKFAWTVAAGVPSDVVVTSDGSTTVTVTWTDNTLNEDGFRIVETTGGAYVDSVAANTETKQITSLIPNTLYDWEVQVKGGALDGQDSAADSAYTFAVALADSIGYELVVTNGDSVKAFITFAAPDTAGTSLPANTLYSIMFVSSAGDTFFVDKTPAILDSLRESLGIDDAWGWNTFAGWNADADTISLAKAGDTGIGRSWKIFARAKNGQW